MRSPHDSTRRSFLSTGAGGLLVAGCAGASAGAAPADPRAAADEVTPAEDLMREHGVLRRIMYLYDDAGARLRGQGEVPLDALDRGAAMIRRVIEDYHERLEEELLFPRFERAGQQVDLVHTLRRQHQVGRQLTDRIRALVAGLLDAARRTELAGTLASFNRMYRAHAAREDTVLFPAIRALVGAKGYDELGDVFEDRERQVLGPDGFEHAVADVAELEKAFGVHDLAKLTP
jgi:hemerythrin-like domain-containing protein